MTKFARIALSLAAFSLSTTALAGTLTSSSNLTILAFDGQKVKKGTHLQVSENREHQVVVEVSSLYQSGSDKHFFESQPIVIRFNGSEEDVKLNAPNLQTELAISKFKKSPTFDLKTASGKALNYQQDYLKGEGFMPNSHIIDNLAHYNAGNGNAAVKNLATNTAVVMQNTKTAKGKITVQGENIAEQQLQYWFQQADKETQTRFLNWAKSHK